MAPESSKDQQTYQMRSSSRTIEHREIMATAMSVNFNGNWALLAGRRVLALQNLDENADSVVRKFSRNCKYEVSSAEFANCKQTQEFCAIATNQLIEVVTWGTSEPTLLHSLRSHTRMVTDIDWHCKEPMLLATCSIDSFTHLWDLRDARKPSMSLNAVCMSGATQVGFNRISGNLLAAAHDGDLRIWDIRKGSAPIHYITAHLARVHGINWSHRRESCLATASQDGTVKYFDVNNPRRAEKIITNSSPVWRARYTPIRNGLVTIIVPHLGRGENSLLLWSNSKQTDPICSFVGHTDVILDFAWRPNRYTNTELELVTWSRDQTLRLWKIDESLLNCCEPVSPDRDLVDDIGTESPPEDNIRIVCDDFQSSEVMEAINIARSPVMHIEPMARSLTDQPTCSLHHEFSLLNTNHPHFQIEDYDAIKRYAVVKVQAAGHIVNIQSKFPTEYPSPNIYPEFRFLSGTTLEDKNCRQFMAIMKRCALQRVKSSRTCFEPCLRILIASMKKTYITNGNDKSLLRLQSPRLEGALSSTLHDACIPFPRTSGVKFNAIGLFVTFAQNLNTRILSSKHSKLTPKALSAISGGLLGNVMGTQPVLYAHRESHHIQDRSNKSSRSKSIHKPITSPMVQIYDFKRLLHLNKEIANDFEIQKNDLVGTCKKSQMISEANGRSDLVPIWKLAELIASSCVPLEENCGELLFCNDPFKRNILESLILHFAVNGDIQTAVMLCAVFHKCCPEVETSPNKMVCIYFLVLKFISHY
ncbi:WDR59 family protein [Megaselia abdita]